MLVLRKLHPFVTKDFFFCTIYCHHTAVEERKDTPQEGDSNAAEQMCERAFSGLATVLINDEFMTAQSKEEVERVASRFAPQDQRLFASVVASPPDGDTGQWLTQAKLRVVQFMQTNVR